MRRIWRKSALRLIHTSCASAAVRHCQPGFFVTRTFSSTVSAEYFGNPAAATTVPEGLQEGERRLHQLDLNGVELCLAEGKDGFQPGARLWDSGQTLAKWINQEDRLSMLCATPSPRILELGSGTGVLGLALSAMGANVLLTDRPKPLSLLTILRSNATRNAEAISTACGSATVSPLEWGNSRQLEATLAWGNDGGSEGLDSGCLGSGFDLVVGADLFYSSSSPFFPVLLDTIEAAVSKPGPGRRQTRVVVAYPLGRDATPEKFFHLAEERGMQVDHLADVSATIHEVRICELSCKHK